MGKRLRPLRPLRAQRPIRFYQGPPLVLLVQPYRRMGGFVFRAIMGFRLGMISLTIRLLAQLD